jgi:Ca2+-binding RTX toxin-like protein
MGTFTGTTSDDFLSGGPGPDTLIGLAGNDIYIVNDPGDVVVENPGEGYDVVYTSINYALNDFYEVEGLVALDTNGTTPLSLTGNSRDNYLIGNAGANVLNGGAGVDILDGRGGNDVYIVDNAGDLVIEAVGQGYDVAYASVNYTLVAGQEVEGLVALDVNATSALNLGGNELANYIIGNAGANLLTGGAGADILEARAGEDTLDGGTGADLLIGGQGNDIYIIDDAGDYISEVAGEGYDVAFASTSYTLAAGSSVEGLVALDVNGTAALSFTGNELANYLIGNAGANVLSGGAGADILEGRGGNDVYIVDNAGDAIVEAAGQGYDVAYIAVNYTLGAGWEIEGLVALDVNATTALTLTGNELANYIIGNAGANVLNGGAGNDVLEARAGDDVLDGGTGADGLFGGQGNDVYYVDNGGDLITEAAGEGYDVAYVTTSYALAAGSEVEGLSTLDWNGTAAINLTGNAVANYIIGNAGANLIDGGAGADVMFGRTGDDIYIVDNVLDGVFENGGEGNDTVRTSVSYTLAANVETLEAAAGSAAINLTGNDAANTLRGNDGANILDGGLGADAMFGGLGDDIYVVDNAGDGVTENAGEGTDTVRTSINYTLGANVETLEAAAGSAALTLTGNSGVNTIRGNDGANIIDGGLGNDTLTGGLGVDTFAFTTALGATNIDAITDFLTGTDKILLGGAVGQPFAALATGSLRAGTLVIGTAALDADDYLIYNSATGALLYDADGVGGNAAVQFATLATGLNLTVVDFTVSGAANTAPAITSGATASVPENSAPTTVVYQIAANDADGDRITYSLSGTDAGLLSVDASGTVRLLASADFETKNSYVFNVIASDSGVATVKAVTLTITDVNETVSTPVISETAASNDAIATAQAISPGALLVAPNPNLYNAAYPSVSIQGSITAPNDDVQADTSTDVDFYSITLVAGQQLILDVDGTNGLDSFLTLYGPNGVALGSNDDTDSFDPGSVETGYGHNVDSQIIFRAATSGTYYFSIKSFVDPDTNLPDSRGSYTLHVSINSTPVTAAQIMAEDVQALVSGASWNHAGPAFTLTYGFPSQASFYPAFKEVTPASDFAPFNGQQQFATRALLQLVANVTQITFTENTTQGAYTTAGTAANANLRYAQSSEANPTAYAYEPTNGGPSSLGGSAWFGINNPNANFNAPQQGNYAWMGILHETGHALGLKHGHEFPLAISPDHDSVEYSVMTYRSYPGKDLSTGGYTNETWGYAQTLMMLDIAALQKIYGGANYNFNSGASVYSWSATTGEMSINGIGQGAPGNGDGITLASENRVFMTVWDGGGNDTYDLSNYSTGTTIDLRPGEWTTTSATQLANLNTQASGPIFARGNVANALLFQGNTDSAIENAIGGAGADTLIANLVANHLTGNGGVDTFKWMTTGDAGTGSFADTVLDFVRGTDKIDLSNLDAQPGTAGQQDFSFIGTAAFHNVAGEVRYDVTGGSAHIFADVDGNGTADMEIILTNITTLAATDFNF